MIERSRIACYEAGLRPPEFEEMSLKQAGAFAEAAERAWVRENRTRAVLADGAVKLLLLGIGRMVDKTVRVPKVEEVFPQWFGKETTAASARSDAEVWMDFLGIGGGRRG